MSIPESRQNGTSDAFPLEPSHMVQVVNYEEQFNIDLLDLFLRQQRISSLGFKYNVTAIMGPQSSGKSTLMNLLFGTQFPTMEADGGRYQVTQGVWLGRDTKASILVMDLEGTDSRERGDDAVAYERKSALFALALAEVLVVNVWIHDVGRNNASNMPLLRTIMELDLQLFFGGDNSDSVTKSVSSDKQQLCVRRMPKTKLLFVIRDYDSTPFDKLCSSLRYDLENIWSTINKPEAALNTPITDYFDLDFEALPHKVYCPEEFESEVAKLRKRFHGGDIFKEEYSRGVAADGFCEYAKSVWETIRANKELDIPSQKEMLAHVRCEQIAKEIFVSFSNSTTEVKNMLLPCDGSLPTIAPTLFASMFEFSNGALDAYIEASSRYSKSVADMKENDVRSHLAAKCKQLFDSQITLASDEALRVLKGTVNTDYSQARPKPWLNWKEDTNKAMQKAMKIFNDACATEVLAEAIPEPSARSIHPLSFAVSSAAIARSRLQASLGSEMERATKRVIMAARLHCMKTFESAFKPPVTTLLENASDDFWRRASEVANVSWEATASEARKVHGPKGLGLEEEKTESLVGNTIRVQCQEKAISDIKSTIGTPSNLLLRMMKRFEDAFRFDERGVPRTFGPSEDIEAFFVVAREKGEELAELLAEVRLEGPLVTAEPGNQDAKVEDDRKVIFNATAILDLKEKLKRQSGVIFMEAKRSQEAARIITKVPIWLLIVLLILGWNEIMAVLRSPLLLMLTIIVVPVVYVGYTLDAPTFLLPAARATLSPLLEQAKDFLEQASGPPAAAQRTFSYTTETESTNSSVLASSASQSDSTVLPEVS